MGHARHRAAMGHTRHRAGLGHIWWAVPASGTGERPPTRQGAAGYIPTAAMSRPRSGPSIGRNWPGFKPPRRIGPIPVRVSRVTG